MKFESKVLCILAMLLVISAVNAADLAKNDFTHDNFEVDIPSGSNFSQTTKTGLNMADLGMEMFVFKNSGNNSDDVSVMIYLKDSSSGKNMMSAFTDDIEREGKVIEENDRYKIIENDEYEAVNFFDSNSSNPLEALMNIFEDVFSPYNDVSVSSGEASSQDGQVSSEGEIEVNDYLTANVHDDDYVAYLKNPENGQVIVIAGNNLETIKAMADTASFK